MDAGTVAVFVAIFIIILIAVSAARGRRGGDVGGGRGPYSTGMEARGGLAAFGATLVEPPEPEPKHNVGSDGDDDD